MYQWFYLEPYQSHSITPNWGAQHCHRGPKFSPITTYPQRKLHPPKLKYETLELSEVGRPRERKVLIHQFFGPI